MDDSVYEELIYLTEKGNNYVDEGDYDNALMAFFEALELIPNPKSDWEATSWIYASIGDVYFVKDNFEDSLRCFYDALNYSIEDNAFIFLRLGQIFFKLSNFEKAEEYLLKSYILEGDEVFEGEEEKYIRLIKKYLWQN